MSRETIKSTAIIIVSVTTAIALGYLVNLIINLSEISYSQNQQSSESEDDTLKSYRTFATVTQADDIPLFYIDINGIARPYEDRINVKTEMTKKFYIFTKEEYREKVSLASNNILC